MPGARVHSNIHSGDFAPKRPIRSVLVGVGRFTQSRGRRRGWMESYYTILSVFVRHLACWCPFVRDNISLFFDIVASTTTIFLLATATTI